MSGGKLLANGELRDADSEQVTGGKRTGQRPAPPEGQWISVDPGQVHVGLVVWLEDELFSAAELSPDDFKSFLRTFRPKFMVIEAFSLRSTRWTGAQASQAQDTLKLIGAAEEIVEQHGGVWVEQQPSVRHVAQASPWWRDIEWTSNSRTNSHARSAAAHGIYYLHFAKR